MRGECCAIFGDPFLENCTNVRDVYILTKSMIGDIPWRIGRGSEKFRLISLDDRCVGFGGTAPQLSIYRM